MKRVEFEHNNEKFTGDFQQWGTCIERDEETNSSLVITCAVIVADDGKVFTPAASKVKFLKSRMTYQMPEERIYFESDLRS